MGPRESRAGTDLEHYRRPVGRRANPVQSPLASNFRGQRRYGVDLLWHCCDPGARAVRNIDRRPGVAFALGLSPAGSIAQRRYKSSECPQPAMDAKPQLLQDPFLDALRKEHVPVMLYLVNGIKLQGEIDSF